MTRIRYRFLTASVLIISILGFFMYLNSELNDASDEVVGEPTYNLNIFANQNEIWVLRAKDLNYPQEYELYRVNEDNEEHFVCLYPGKEAHWNKETEKLYYLSENNICEFDCNNGSTKIYFVKKKYTRICAVEGNYVFLQDSLYGPVTRYSILTGDETILEVQGWVLNVCNGYLFTWDVYHYILTCHKYNQDIAIWEMNLSDQFSNAPVLCENGGDLYFGNSQGGYIYVLENYADNTIFKNTEIYARVLGMICMEDKIIYASNERDSIHFCSIDAANRKSILNKWNNDSMYDDQSILLQVYGNKMFFASKKEQELYSVSLNVNE